MKKFILAFMALGGIAYGVTQSASTVWNVANSAGTADLIQLSNTGALAVEGTITSGGVVVPTVANATYTATVAKAASAIQPTTATYTATVAKAASALQPNAASYTNVVVSGDGKTNTIIVIGGQITSWVVTQ